MRGEPKVLPMHGELERNIPIDGEAEEVSPELVSVATTVDPRLLSMDDAARSLNITTRELRDRIDAKELRSVYIGRRRLVPLAEIDGYVARLLQGPSTKRDVAA